MEIDNIIANLPKEEKEKLPKFYANVLIAKENMDNSERVIDALAEYGIKINTAIDLRVLTVDSRVVEVALAKLKSCGELEMVLSEPQRLRYQIEDIINRIVICKNVNKGYVGENGYCSFIFNDDEWEEIIKGIEIDDSYATVNNTFSQEETELSEMIKREEPNLDDKQFIKYSELLSVLSAALEVSYGFADVGDYAESVLRKLIAYSDYSDLDILLATLVTTKNLKKDEIDGLLVIMQEHLETNKISEEGSRVSI